MTHETHPQAKRLFGTISTSRNMRDGRHKPGNQKRQEFLYHRAVDIGDDELNQLNRQVVLQHQPAVSEDTHDRHDCDCGVVARVLEYFRH